MTCGSSAVRQYKFHNTVHINRYEEALKKEIYNTVFTSPFSKENAVLWGCAKEDELKTVKQIKFEVN